MQVELRSRPGNIDILAMKDFAPRARKYRVVHKRKGKQTSQRLGKWKSPQSIPMLKPLSGKVKVRAKRKSIRR
jgi:hypothetical protein